MSTSGMPVYVRRSTSSTRVGSPPGSPLLKPRERPARAFSTPLPTPLSAQSIASESPAHPVPVRRVVGGTESPGQVRRALSGSDSPAQAAQVRRVLGGSDSPAQAAQVRRVVKGSDSPAQAQVVRRVVGGSESPAQAQLYRGLSQPSTPGPSPKNSVGRAVTRIGLMSSRANESLLDGHGKAIDGNGRRCTGRPRNTSPPKSLQALREADVGLFKQAVGPPSQLQAREEPPLSLRDNFMQACPSVPSQPSQLPSWSTDEPPLNQKQVEELVHESLKLVISNVHESLGAFEKKLEAVVQQMLIPVTTRINKTVTQLEDRITVLMKATASSAALLGEHTQSLAVHDQLLRMSTIDQTGSSAREIGSYQDDSVADPISKQTVSSIAGTQTPTDSMKQWKELHDMSVLVHDGIDEIRKTQSETLANDAEKFIQTLQAQLGGLRDGLLEVELHGRAQRLAGDSGQLPQALDDVKKRVENLQAQSDTMAANLSTRSLATAALDEPASMNAELETRMHNIEAHLSAFTDQQAGDAGESMEHIARVECMFSELEGAGLKVRDEMCQLQSHVVQLQIRIDKLETRVENFREPLSEAPQESEEASPSLSELAQMSGKLQALHGLENELQMVRSLCIEMASMIDSAANDFLWCRRNTDCLLEDVRSIVRRSDGLTKGTTEAQNGLLDDVSLNGSITAVHNDPQVSKDEVKQPPALEIRQLRRAVNDLQDQVQNPRTQVSAQALADLQQVILQLLGRVDRLVESEFSAASPAPGSRAALAEQHSLVRQSSGGSMVSPARSSISSLSSPSTRGDRAKDPVGLHLAEPGMM